MCSLSLRRIVFIVKSFFHDLFSRSITLGYRRSQGMIAGYRGLQEITRGYRRIQGVTTNQEGIQGVRGGYIGL